MSYDRPHPYPSNILNNESPQSPISRYPKHHILSNRT